jgi:hypothetical protein
LDLTKRALRPDLIDGEASRTTGSTSATRAAEVLPADDRGTAMEIEMSIGSGVADRGLERLSPERIAEIRHRLKHGHYALPAVLTQVAMRLLQSGEVR